MTEYPDEMFEIAEQREALKTHQEAGVPPVTTTVAVPTEVPAHRVPVLLMAVASGVGSPIVMLSMMLQPLLSVTVTVYVPAVMPVMLAVVAPVLHT